MGEDALQSLGKVQRGFFYCPKTSKFEREYGLNTIEEGERKCYNGAANGAIGGSKAAKNTHPTVKPVDLMRWLVRLVTPKGGLVLDPFTGSGSTGIAAVLEECDFIGIDITPEYLTIAKHRINAWQGRQSQIKP